jgi:hypothetical protein
MNSPLKKITIIPIIASVALAAGSGNCNVTGRTSCIQGYQSSTTYWAGIDIDVCVGGQESGFSSCTTPIEATCVSGIWVRNNAGQWVYSGQNMEAKKLTSRATGEACPAQ